MKLVACIFFLLLLQSSISAQWSQTSGPSGGGVSDFAFLKNGNILAATFDLGNGVYASTDNGTSWHESGLQGTMLTHIFANGNTVLVASTHNSYNETDTVYRSSDGGGSWQNVLSASNIIGIRSISYYQNQWFLSTQGQNGRLLVSPDDGISWDSTRKPAFNFSHPVILLPAKDSIYAGSTDNNGHLAVFSSFDGFTWRQSMLSIDQSSGNEIHSAVRLGNNLLFGINGGILTLPDGASSWWEPPIPEVKDASEYFTRIAGSGSVLIAVSSLDNVYRSFNSGQDWGKLIGNGLPANASYFFSVGVNSNDGAFFLGSSSGILREDNSSNHWFYSTKGLRAATVTELAVNGGKVFAATERGVAYSSDEGTSWHDPQDLSDLNDVPISGFLPSGNNFLAYGAGLYSWNGSSWTPIDTMQVTSLAEGSSGRLIASTQSSDPIAGTGGIVISDNGGSGWTGSLLFTNSFDTEYYFLPHCIASNGAGVILAIQRAIIYQTFSSVYTVYRSNDNGTSWTVVGTVSSPAFLEHIDNSFYMGTYASGLFRSDDNGSTWVALSGLASGAGITSLLKIDITFLASVTGNGTALDGLYFSTDAGTTWKYANNGTANIFGPIADDGTFLYSGGPSVWKRPLQGLDVPTPKATPQSVSLEVYPNPAGDMIHLHLSSFGSMQATILVYDEKGMALLKQEIYLNGDAKDIPISISGLAGGANYCSVEDNSGNVIARAKFVKE